MIDLRNIINSGEDYLDSLEQMKDLEHMFSCFPENSFDEANYNMSDEFWIHETEKKDKNLILEDFEIEYIESYFSEYKLEERDIKNSSIFGIELESEEIRSTILNEINQLLLLNSASFNEDRILARLYDACPTDNIDTIYNIVKIINLNTSHTVTRFTIYNKLIKKYELYIRDQINHEDLINLIKTRSIEASLGILIEDSVHLSEDKTYICYRYENQPISLEEKDMDYYAEALYFANPEMYDEYEHIDVMIYLEEAKNKYMEEHIYNYCGMFKNYFYNAKLQNYQYVKKDNDVLTNLNQVKNTILFTLDKIVETLQIKVHHYTSPIMITRKKLLKEGRNQQFNSLLELMSNANVDYVIQDENGNYFYPFLLNIFYQALESKNIIVKYKDFVKTFKDLKYQANKLNYDLPLYRDATTKKIINYAENIKEKQVWHYTMTLYAKQYNCEYLDMWKLIKFFIYENQNDHNNWKKPMEHIPSEIVEINKFSNEVI